MARHFVLAITDERFTFRRHAEAISAESQLDGFDVMRTDLSQAALGAPEVVRAGKGLCEAEQAFRPLKTVALEIRPIHHRLADWVRAHVLLCMLACYLE